MDNVTRVFQVDSIILLNHSDSEIAEGIYQLFQASYSVEA